MKTRRQTVIKTENFGLGLKHNNKKWEIWLSGWNYGSMQQ